MCVKYITDWKVKKYNENCPNGYKACAYKVCVKGDNNAKCPITKLTYVAAANANVAPTYTTADNEAGS